MYVHSYIIRPFNIRIYLKIVITEVWQFDRLLFIYDLTTESSWRRLPLIIESSTTAKFQLPFYHFMLKNESDKHFAAFSFVTLAEVVDVCTWSVLQFIEFVHFHAKASWRSTCEGDSVENSSPNLWNTARPSRTLLHAGLSRSRGSRPSTTRTSSSSLWLYCVLTLLQLPTAH